jgi:hypothetical protein
MVLLVSGCSQALGYETAKTDEECKKYAFGAHISKYLNADYINIAEQGISNNSIVNKTIDWIENNCIKNKKYKFSDLIILIGWTENGRYLLKEKKIFFNKMHLKTYLASDTLTEILAKKFIRKLTDIKNNKNLLMQIDPSKAFSHVMYKQIFDSVEDVTNQIFTMISLNCYLQKYNIKYFTFPTMRITDIEKYKHLTDLLHPVNNFPFVYQNKCFRLTEYFGEEYIAPEGHLTRFGHIKAAQWIKKQLHERNIL